MLPEKFGQPNPSGMRIRSWITQPRDGSSSPHFQVVARLPVGCASMCRQTGKGLKLSAVDWLTFCYKHDLPLLLYRYALEQRSQPLVRCQT